MKIDVEDVLCKAEAISLQMVKCKVYSVLNNCKVFYIFGGQETIFFLRSKINSFSSLKADTKDWLAFCLLLYIIDL